MNKYKQLEADIIKLMNSGSKVVEINESTTVADKHQHKIACDTIKNPSKSLIGGTSLQEAEDILRNKFGYSDEKIQKLREEVEPMNESAPKGHTIEARGTKGMKATYWKKTFKHADHLNQWAENNSADVDAVRDLDKNEMHPETAKSVTESEVPVSTPVKENLNKDKPLNQADAIKRINKTSSQKLQRVKDKLSKVKGFKD